MEDGNHGLARTEPKENNGKYLGIYNTQIG